MTTTDVTPPTPVRALGLMSGTSYDGVDVAVIDTDGVAITSLHGGHVEPYAPAERAAIAAAVADTRAWGFDGAEPASFARAEAAVHAAHVRAAIRLLDRRPDLEPSVIGFHGQTVLHRPPAPGRVGATRQLGDGETLARALGRPVVFDFRAADVAAGGQGAPFAPVYHWARARMSGLAAGGVGVLNLGGVANLTCLADAAEDLLAFDTGPASGMLDAFVSGRGAGAYDDGGRLAAAGRVDQAALAALLDHPFFDAAPPKSLDRFAFSPEPVAALSLEDGAATLVAFAAEAVARGIAAARRPVHQLIATGGGVRNPVLLAAIAGASGAVVAPAADLGWDGDLLEAEAFAYLAVRRLRGLPASFPGTTGAPKPLAGGRIAQPPGAAAYGVLDPMRSSR